MTLEAVHDAKATKTTSWTIDHAGLSTEPLPVSGYIDPDYYEREITHIWKRTWLHIGKVHRLANPGDFFVRELRFASTSIIVARARDGKIRAFHNVCSHRCNKLVTERGGNARAFRCGFHGWVYGVDGSLKIITDESNFFDIDKSQFGLTEVHCETWKGHVFINLAPEPPETLREYLGDFCDYLDPYPFEEMTQQYTWTVELDCNWKIARDTFIELYHVSTVHSNSFAASFSSRENPYSQNLYYRTSGLHAQLSTYANPDYQPHPMESLAFVLSGGLASLMDKRKASLPGGVNPANAENWSADVNALFPSVGLFTFAGLYGEVQWWPVSVDKCVFEISQCMRPPGSHVERWMQEVGQATFQTGIMEDVKNTEQSHAMMKSGAKKVFVLQDEEVAVRQSHHCGQLLAGPYPKA